MKNNILALALAAGLILPTLPAHAAEEVSNPTPAEVNITEDAPTEAKEGLMASPEESTPATTNLSDEAQNPSTEAEADEEEEIDMPDDDGRIEISFITQKFVINGQENDINTLVQSRYGNPLAYYVNFRDLLVKANNSGLAYDLDILETDPSNIHITTGKAYTSKPVKFFTGEEANKLKSSSFEGNIVVDGANSTPVSGIIVDDQIYLKASEISKALDFRIRADVKDSNVIKVDNTKSDIYVPTAEELDSEIAKSDYTLLVNWGPWCPWSKHELPLLEEYYQNLQNDNKYKVNVIGLINKSKDYTEEEISVLFKDGKAPFKNYGTDEALNNHLAKLFGSKIAGFPTSFVVNSKGEKQGEEVYEYYETYKALYIKDKGMTEEEYDEKYQTDFKKMDVDDDVKRVVYNNYLDYAIAGKKVSLEDKSYTDNNKPSKPTATKENKAPAKEVKSDNPKTGVMPVAGIASIMGLAFAGLKKTKNR